MNQALSRRVAARYWLRSPFVLTRPTRTQNANGEWVHSWTQIYPSVAVPAPLCYVQEAGSTVLDANGQPVVVTTITIHFDPTLTITAKDRVAVNGQTFELEKVVNPDPSLSATLQFTAQRRA